MRLSDSELYDIYQCMLRMLTPVMDSEDFDTLLLNPVFARTFKSKLKVLVKVSAEIDESVTELIEFADKYFIVEDPQYIDDLVKLAWGIREKRDFKNLPENNVGSVLSKDSTDKMKTIINSIQTDA